MRTKALIEAQKRYNINHDRINLYLEFGTLAKIDKLGYNRSDFIKKVIYQAIEDEYKKRGVKII